jgi:hypothetical protein
MRVKMTNTDIKKNKKDGLPQKTQSAEEEYKTTNTYIKKIDEDYWLKKLKS